MRRHKYTSVDEISGKLIDIISRGTRHANYIKTVSIAEFWRKMVTGKGHQDMIVSYRPSETENQKTQRLRVYKPRTKYLLNRVRTQIKKSDRVDYSIGKIQYEGVSSDEKIKELTKRLDCLHGDQNAKNYLNSQFRHLNEVDPNAFLMINFHAYNPINEKPFVYPTVIGSELVYDFEYWNGTLQYLCYQDKVVATDTNGDAKETELFYIVAPNYTIALQKHIKDQANIEADTVDIDDDKYYHFVYETRSTNVPAVRVGYTMDPSTDGQIMESIFYPAKEILEDIINKKSELDVNMLLHGIIQKFAYVPKCNNHDEKTNQSCDGGVINNKKCSKCNGTGVQQFHTSSQDIITMNLALDSYSKPDEIIDLSKLIHYAQVPEHIIQLYKDTLKELEKDVSNAMFNVDVFSKDHNEAKTPEAIRSRNDALNNVLFEYCSAKAEAYTFIVRQTADYMDMLNGLITIFRPPTDYRLENLDDLLSQYKLTEGAPTEVREGVLQKIHFLQNQDNPSAVAKIKAREKWRPFRSMTEAERLNAVEMLPDEHPEKVLWLRFDRIFSDIENAKFLNIDDNVKTNVKFWEIGDHDIQKAIVDRVVNKYVEEAKSFSPSFRDVLGD